MGKYAFDHAVAFATQADEDTYNAGLDAITTDLQGERIPGGADDDDGLILGDPGSGVGESGLSLALGRRSRDKAFLAGGFTRPLSDFLALEGRTFSFAFPFCNHRADVTGTPADADFVPHVGLDALLEGVGMQGAASGTPGHEYKFDTVNAVPISALIYVSGSRLELKSCRVESLAISYVPGSIAIATATIAIGSVQDPSASPVSVAALPTTLDYATQASVSAPTIESVGFGWQATRGFSELTITITPTIEDIPDSNQPDGIIKEVSGRVTTIEGTLFGDDASSNEVYSLEALLADAVGDLDALSFTVGSAAGASEPALAHSWTFPQPEIDESTFAKLGSKAADTVTLIARHGTVNEEAALEFL